MVSGLVATGALAAVSRLNYLHTEAHLTAIQAKLTATTLAAVGPTDVRRRLGRAVAITAATGDPALFGPQIDGSLAPAGPFADASLFALGPSGPELQQRVGVQPLLAASSTRVRASTALAARTGQLVVLHVVAGRAQRLGYFLAVNGPSGTDVGYAEQALPASRRVALKPGNPDAALRIAVYLGRARRPGNLLEANAPLPLRGRTVRVTAPFGNQVLSLVVSSRGSLAGGLAQALPWGIAGVGTLLTVWMAVAAGGLVRRRAVAEASAVEHRRLYQQQRSVSETLQHALLPSRLPRHPGMEVAARYLPATAELHVGGDWYDVLDLGPDGIFFTVGDVVGHGVEAAVLMAALRHAVTAHALDGDEPGTVLAKLGRLVDVGPEGRFATVLCGRLHLDTGRLSLGTAGHLPPVLLLSAGSCAPLAPAPAPPVGVGGAPSTMTTTLPPGATLLAFTDGLVERRGEPVTDGIARLCAAARPGLSVDALVDELMAGLLPDGPADDVALVALRRV